MNTQITEQRRLYEGMRAERDAALAEIEALREVLPVAADVCEKAYEMLHVWENPALRTAVTQLVLKLGKVPERATS